MYKTIVIPSNKEMINNISSDAILLGIKDLSVNMPFYITLDELKKIKTKKEIFIIKIFFFLQGFIIPFIYNISR